MDFRWSKEEVEFRETLRSAIETYSRPDWSHEDFQLDDPELVEECREFCVKLAEAGLLTPMWPLEYGGRNASPWEQVVISEEMHGSGEPRGPQYINVNWLANAIMLFGTEAQKSLHLPQIASGNAFWCQGFSEPDAGSDLSSLRTAAIRDGDIYVVNGQKTWTSYAHVADYCFLLARTDPHSSGRDGISALLVPMDLPGIEVRAIPNISGLHMIHDVYFSDVLVPTTCLLGDEHSGWKLISQVLADERIGIARFERSARVLDHAVTQRLKTGPLNALESSSAGRALVMNEAARILNYVAVGEKIYQPEGPRPRASISRVATIRAMKAVAESCRDLLGPEFFLEPEVDQMIVAAITTPIASGSYEMQLNNIARRSLGLKSA